MHVEGGQRALGQVFEGDRELAGCGFGVTVPGELDVGGEAVGDEEDPVAVPGQWLAEIDGARQRSGQRRAVDLEAADLGEFGAVGCFVGAEVGFRVGAGGLAVGGVGIDREARRQGDRRARAAQSARGSSG